VIPYLEVLLQRVHFQQIAVASEGEMSIISWQVVDVQEEDVQVLAPMKLEWLQQWV
jgi:hypothetical protein